MSDDKLNLKGYHGTLMDRARTIQHYGFRSSNKEKEWLGFGVYFFEKFSFAKAWAQQESNRLNSAFAPAVITVDITLPHSGFLDLDIPDVMHAFEHELKHITTHILSMGSGGAPKFKDDCQLRCFFCNLYTDRHKEIKVIAFSFPRTTYSSMGFPLVIYKRQLCVIDGTCIGIPPNRLEAV